MDFICAIFGTVLVLLVLVDGFEAMILPRRVTQPFRFARLFYRNTWMIWRFVATHIPNGKRREAFLSLFGPLSLLGLFATWVVGLVIGFALLHSSLESPLQSQDREIDFFT